MSSVKIGWMPSLAALVDCANISFHDSFVRVFEFATEVVFEAGTDRLGRQQLALIPR
jgi:hypothetical protein